MCRDFVLMSTFFLINKHERCTASLLIFRLHPMLLCSCFLTKHQHKFIIFNEEMLRIRFIKENTIIMGKFIDTMQTAYEAGHHGNQQPSFIDCNIKFV